LVQLAAGATLSDTVDKPGKSVYLVRGELELMAGGRAVETLTPGSEMARFALSQVRAGQLSARAKTAIELLCVDEAAVSKLLICEPAPPAAGGAGGRVLKATSSRPDWLPRLWQSSLFQRVPAENFQRLFTLLEPIPVRAGDTVIRQGESGDYYYIVKEGRCEVVRHRAPGNPLIRLGELAEGDSFGEEALLSGAKRNASVRMLADGVLLRLTKDDFTSLIKAPMTSGVSMREAREKVAQGAVWLDVRLGDEHRNNGLPGSLNLPLSEVRARAQSLEPKRTYIVYSNSGIRSAAAAFLLNERGFVSHVLESGLGAYAQPTSPPEPQATTPVVHDKRGSDGQSTTGHLRAALARADAELESAFRQKAEATIARQFWSKGAPSIGDHDRTSQIGEATVARLQERQKMHSLQSTSASQALARAKRRKLELEMALRAAEAETARERAKAEAACAQLREQAEARLAAEGKRLEAQYESATEQMERLKSARREAEARLQEERNRLEAEFDQAQQRLQADTERVQQKIDEAQQQAQAVVNQIRADESAAEQRLRAETETRLRGERERLEAELASNVTQLQKAEQALADAEAKKRAAEQEAKRVAAEIKAAEAKRKAETEAKRAKERKRLDQLAAAADQRLQQALQRKRECEDTNQPTGAMAGTRARTRGDEVETPQSGGADAHEEVDAARKARNEAELAKYALEEQMVRQQVAEDELRMQLYEETEEWLRKERTDQPDEHSAEDLLKAMGDTKILMAMRESQDKAEDDMMADVLGQLGSKESPGLEAPSERAYAAEKEALARSAERDVAVKREKAKAALERARAQIAQLQEKMRKVGNEAS
jgi:CRP-like cAMP-binding protein